MSTESVASKPKAVVDEAVNQGELAFAVAAIGNSEGQLWAHAAGHRDINQRHTATSDNIIQIASMTKLVTSIAALQLVERGLLALDEPADVHIAELANLRVLTGFDAGGKGQFEDARRAPTVRELITHTAGFVYEIWNENEVRAVSTGLAESFLGGGNFRVNPLAFQPGTQWEYGTNTDWLGALIEQRSGERLVDYFEKNIFDPLGMKDTHFELPEDKLHRSVAMMARAEEQMIASPSNQPVSRDRHSMPFYSGGGGLYSTVDDYGSVLQMLLSAGTVNGSQVLSASTVDDMFDNHIGDLRPGPLVTQVPEVSNTADLGFAAPATFGLGLLIHPDGLPGGRRSNTGSWAGLF
ncbi:MAG TPA: 1,4-butanediol diacrylate esterase, partial [Gammaproteobacteria bacterium]|nr:1,4-butanediol diacrylate esterase [Gammaproteobacteria bacterium]